MKNKKQKNLLVTLADKNYIEQAKQLFSSVYWNAGWKGDYMLLSHNVPEKHLKWFRKKGILIKKCKHKINKANLIYSPKPCKFFLFTPEFKKWDKIVYLDVDIIVRDSLEELTKVKKFRAVLEDPINNKLLDQFTPPEREKKQKFDKLRKTYDIKAEAFNSGVIAFNTNIINKILFSKLNKLLLEYNDIEQQYLVDQPILNLYFSENWEKLPLVYNLDIGDFKFINLKKINAIIFHFRGEKDKPWLTKSPFYNEYTSNLKKAEKINLKKAQNPKRIWTKKKADNYSLYLKIRCFTSFSNFRRIINRFFGLIAIKLYIYFPKLYFKIKKLK